MRSGRTLPATQKTCQQNSSHRADQKGAIQVGDELSGGSSAGFHELHPEYMRDRGRGEVASPAVSRSGSGGVPAVGYRVGGGQGSARTRAVISARV